MTDLIEIQFITAGTIIAIFSIALGFGLFERVFRALGCEEGFPVFRGIVIAAMLYLGFLIARDAGKVLWNIL